MNIVLLGASHHKTPVETREVLAKIKLQEASLHLKGDSLEELILFSTCNRFEFLIVSKNKLADIEKIFCFLSEKTEIPVSNFKNYFYIYEELEAIKHLFEVAAGLDSLVLGEPQILGQLKDAFKEALNIGTAGFTITQLMHKCFNVAKKIKTETNISCGAVSVSYAAIKLLEQDFKELKNLKVLIVGAGKMANLAVLHLKGRVKELSIISRTLKSAEKLAEKTEAQSYGWEELNEKIKKVDVIITVLSSPEAVLSKKDFYFLKNEEKKMFLIDLGLPRNINDNVSDFKNLQLKNIDDLEKAIDENKELRVIEAEKAKNIIENESYTYLVRSKDNALIASIITSISKNAEEARNLEIERTFKRLGFSEDQKKVLNLMTKALVRRLLHMPIKSLKTFNRQKDLEIIKKILEFDD